MSAPRGRGPRLAAGALRLRLRNALLPFDTTLGMVFSFVLGANGWSRRSSPGPDRLLCRRGARGLRLRGGAGLRARHALLFVVLNLVIDLTYSVIDPQLRDLRK